MLEHLVQSMRAHADAVLVQQFACGAAKNMIFKHPANQAQSVVLRRDDLTQLVPRCARQLILSYGHNAKKLEARFARLKTMLLPSPLYGTQRASDKSAVQCRQQNVSTRHQILMSLLS